MAACLVLALAASLEAGSRSARVDSLYTRFARGRSPGAAVVVLQGGSVLFRGAYGLADLSRGEAVETNTVFHLASASKQMTALAIMVLAERGALRYDSPVATYLPEFRGWGERVTVRHLLHHVGGVPDYYEAFDENDQPDNADALRLLARWRRLDFRPGTRHAYSNAGYDVLGALVERVSGRAFGAFMEENLFGPAGMRDTFAFDEARLRRAKRAHGYSRQGRRYVLDDESHLNGLHGSGSICSTVEDLARYDRALFGHRLVREEALLAAFRPFRLRNGNEVAYGFGLELGKDEKGRRYYGHSGEWMGFASYYLRYPRERLSIILLSNASDAPTEDLAFQTAALFLQ